MKTVILAAGFGTRFVEDVDNDPSGRYKNLRNVPKALLPISNIPLLSYWAILLSRAPCITDVHVVINGLYEKQFVRWLKMWPGIKLVRDGGSMSNDTRRGAVPCMKFGVDSIRDKDDVLVLAGDVLFPMEFSLQDVLDYFYLKKEKNSTSCVILYAPCEESEVHKRGIIETDDMNRVISFKEKPHPSETTSRKQCPCFYILSKDSLPLIDSFLRDHEDAPKSEKDATGLFINYLIKKVPVYAHKISRRYDVGSLETYIECCNDISAVFKQQKYC